ncbi:MAG: hypothetical protein IKF36_00515 [Bacilli bacterium]|nr:hypothetical protein [Bacilli bacterium]
MSKYEQLRNVIINSKELSDEKKVLLLRVLDIYLSFDSEKDAIDLENDIYFLDGVQLSDIERVTLEYSRLCKMNNIIAEQNPNDEKAHEFFTKKVETYSLTKDIGKKKELLNEYLLDEEKMPSFCSTYDALLEKYMNLNDIKDISEYKFTNKIKH